jgi:hypothetical protein
MELQDLVSKVHGGKPVSLEKEKRIWKNALHIVAHKICNIVL